MPSPLQTPHSSKAPTQSSTSSHVPSASTSSQGASPDVASSATSGAPPAPEKIKLSIESQSTPVRNVPDPAGTKPPENEKPRTVVPLP